MPSVSPRNRLLASISTPCDVPSGWLATGVLPTRLTEYAASTANACGVPGLARNVSLSATSCTRLWILRNSTS